VVGSYLRAFDEIEAGLEKFDVAALTAPSRDPEPQIRLLTEARQRVGGLRRSLAPHREVFAALSHSEFDPLSSETSGQRFVELTARLDSALASARDVKDAVASSFDVLIVRTEHRTSEIVKILTIVSILLLRLRPVLGSRRRDRRDRLLDTRACKNPPPDLVAHATHPAPADHRQRSECHAKDATAVIAGHRLDDARRPQKPSSGTTRPWTTRRTAFLRNASPELTAATIDYARRMK
jgi:hypothetical protein